MKRKPKWIWQQRRAVAHFLIGFHLRRIKRFVGVSVLRLPWRRAAPAPVRIYPSRRRPAASTVRAG